jgi:transcriptional regulator with XRE-family HTH domain
MLLAMTSPKRAVGFGVYLKEAIRAAGFPTPTHFARAAGTDPSVVLRWLSEEQRPTIRSIERIAPVLGQTINALVVAAYPDRLAPPADTAENTVVAELSTMLAGDSPLPVADRQALEATLDRMIEPYRKAMRRRRSA